MEKEIGHLFDATVMDQIVAGAPLTKDADFHRFLPFFRKIAIEHGLKVAEMVKAKGGKDRKHWVPSKNFHLEFDLSGPTSMKSIIERVTRPNTSFSSSFPQKKSAISSKIGSSSTRKGSSIRKITNRKFHLDPMPRRSSSRSRSRSGSRIRVIRNSSRSRSPQRSRTHSAATTDPMDAFDNFERGNLLVGNAVHDYFFIKNIYKPTIVACNKASEVPEKIEKLGEQKYVLSVACFRKRADIDNAMDAFLALKQKCEFIKIIGPDGTDFGRVSKRFTDTPGLYDEKGVGYHILKSAQAMGHMATVNPIQIR